MIFADLESKDEEKKNAENSKMREKLPKGRGRRTQKRNTVERPSADVEVFVVADREAVAVHGNVSMEGYILTMMNMVRLSLLLLFLVFCRLLNVCGNVFSAFGIVKVSQISRTFVRVLAECRIKVFAAKLNSLL